MTIGRTICAEFLTGRFHRTPRRGSGGSLIAERCTACVVLLCLSAFVASNSHANSIFSTDCVGIVSTQESYEIRETVCVSGDVDRTCPGEVVPLPGADVYVVATGDSDPFNAVAPVLEMRGIVASAGAFFDVAAWAPPLVPGAYDLVLDESCDGVFGANDLRVVEAFTVLAPAVPSMKFSMLATASLILVTLGMRALGGRR